MQVEVAFTGVAVSDLQRAGEFYARLFGRAADIVVSPIEVMWCLVSGGAWLYLVVDGERAGASLVTLSFHDLDAVLAEVAGRGIDAPPVDDVPGAGRKATLRDPDGNSVALIEVLSG